MDLKLDVVGTPFEAPGFDYDWKTCATYALGIGAGTDALDYVWENATDFKVYPSFAVVPTQPIVMDALRAINANFRTLVHGAQTITMHRAIKKSGTLNSVGRVTEVQDKGKGAVVIIDTETHDEDGLVFETRWSIFCRGQGGFGGERGSKPTMPEAKPEAAPAFSRTMQTSPDQALLYRLSGDLNPLHIDPALATKVGFTAPILHGLCTYGYATRAVIEALCDGDPNRLASFEARFSNVVYPGSALIVEALPTTREETYLLQMRVGEDTVLSGGIVHLRK